MNAFSRLAALVSFGMLAVSHAAVFQNLVVNGTFTVASGQAGAGWTGTYSQRSSGPVLNGGGNYFYAGSVSSREVNQVYTLTSSEQALCKGAVGVSVQGMRYFLSADLFGYLDQNDYSRVIVEFRNLAGTVLASHTLDSRSTRPPTWASTLTAGQAPNYQSGSGWAPLGTTSVRTRVIATRAQGDNNNGYVDNVHFELQPSNFIKPIGPSGDLVKIAPGQIETQNSAPFVQVAAGYSHSLALKTDGTVVAWGNNTYGQSSVPSGLSGVTAIAAGGNHSLVLKSDGTVVAWGSISPDGISMPVGLSGVTAIAAGASHSLALKSDGSIVAWGYNEFGQSSVPTELSGVTAIAAGGYHSLALKGDGTVVAWGLNSSGPTSVPSGLSGVTAIVAGEYHSLALKGDGTVAAWGDNASGQSSVPAGLSGVTAIAAGGNRSLALKGDGTVVNWGSIYFDQISVPSGLSGVKAIAAGGGHSLALKGDGTVVAWGDNTDGQSSVPVSRPGISAIAAGAGHSFALRSDGRVVAWGNNTYGQSTVPEGLAGVVTITGGAGSSLAVGNDGTVVAWGNNDFGQRNVPIGLTGVIAISSKTHHNLALKDDGTVVAWGHNNALQCSVPEGLSGITAIAAGNEHSLALRSDGTVVAWGSNSFGETSVPEGLSGVLAIAAGFGHSLALKEDGTVVVWGRNAGGQGAAPAGLTGVIAISAGLDFSLALKDDGTVVAWGDNGSGQTMMPTGLSGVIAIAAGEYHSLALKDDGTILTWGSSQNSVPASLSGVSAISSGVRHTLELLGDGTIVAWGSNGYGESSVPSGLSGVTAIAAGGYHSLALKSDGSVVAWGSNSAGQRSLPAGLSGVTAIAAGEFHSLALKGDGTVVAWGRNIEGQSSVPAGLSGVTAIAAGAYHSLALKGDGTVVAWGRNIEGQRSAPAGLSGVTAIAAGAYHSLALKGDGTVVAWGRNIEGQRSVPAGLSGVTAIAAGLHGSAARLSNGRWITWGQAPSTADDPWWVRSVLTISSGPYGLTHVIRSTQPQSPHRLFLAKGAIWENRGEAQDSLWPDDPNRGDTHTYQLVSGEGGEDNGMFTLVGQTLTLNATVDYEQKSSYRLRARVTDSTGLSHEQALVLAVVDDDLEDADNDGLTQRQETALGASDANPDMDNDGYLDGSDALPFNSAEWLDTDGDGTGNNSDPDDDNDGIPDGEDPNPLTQDFGPNAMDLTNTIIMENQSPVGVGVFSSTGSANAGTLIFTLVAGQGSADNSLFSIAGDELMLPAALNFEQAAQRSIRVRVTDSAGLYFERTFTLAVLDDDQEDSDNDGLTQAQETALGTSDLIADTDGDSYLDGADDLPLDPNESRDTDGDGIGNNSDPDDDNDGAVDAIDAFPLNDQEMVDSDGDGVGNNSDQDDDNDNTADTVDPTPEGTNPARLDLGFGTIGRVTLPLGPGDDIGRSIALQPDGAIVVAGSMNNGSNSDFAVARFTPNGVPDNTFSSDGIVNTPVGAGLDFAHALAIQADGKLVVAGQSHNGGNYDFAVLRYLPNGSLDTTFSADGIFTMDLAGGDERLLAVHVQSDGRILLAGDTRQGFIGQFALLRLTTTGIPDTAFGGGTGLVLAGFGSDIATARDIAVQDDGKIVVAGEADEDLVVARYLPTGSVDSTFNGTGHVVTDVSGSGNRDSGPHIALDQNGRILIAGTTSNTNALDVAVIRYTHDGGMDASFGDGGIVVVDVAGDNDGAQDVAVRDGKILVAGTTWNPQDNDFLLMRFTASGDLDADFNGNGMAVTRIGNGSDPASAVAIQPDGRILVAGASSNGTNYDFALLRHMGDPPVPQIIVEQTYGDKLADNSSILAFKATSVGAPLPEVKSLVIRNIGKASLNPLVFSIEGPGANHFELDVSSTATSVPQNGSTTFGVMFSPTAAGFHAAMLKITSNDPDESPYEIHLSGYAGGLPSFQQGFGDNGVVRTSFSPSSYYAFNEYGNAMALQSEEKIVVVGRVDGLGGSDAILARYHPNGVLDASFNTGGRVTAAWPGGDDSANAVAIQNDARIVVAGYSGGDFAVARYTTLGVPDVSFMGGVITTDFSGQADVGNALVVQGDGRILVAGSAMVNGTNCFAVARYMENGALDPTFGTGGKTTTAFNGSATAYGMALDVNGRIIVVGHHSGAVPGVALACYLEDGSLDPAFGAAGKVVTTVDFEGIGRCVQVQSDGRIVVGGCTSSGGLVTSQLLLARYLPNGGLDTSFNGTGIATAGNGAEWDFRYGFTMALQSDGRVLIGGNTVSEFTLARLTASGAPDTTFHGTGLVEIGLSSTESFGRSIAVRSDGDILMAGSSISPTDFTHDLTLVRMDPSGSANQPPAAHAGGPYGIEPGDALSLDASLSSDPDASGGSGIVSYAWMIGEGPDFDDAGGPSPRLTWEMLNQFGITRPGSYRVRLRVTDALGYSNTDDATLVVRGDEAGPGEFDPSFGTGGRAFAYSGTRYWEQDDKGHAVAIQSDGRIVVAGSSGPDFALARFTPDGLLDPDFSGDGKLTTRLPGGGAVAHAVLVQPDGKILAAGQSGSDFGLMRYTAAGVPDVSFNGGTVITDFGGSDSGQAAVMQADGRIVVAGWAQISGQWRFALARYLPNGQLDPSFGTSGKTTTAFDGNAYGYAVAMQPDGKIVIAGHLTNSTTPGVALARYLADGSLDPSFGGNGKVVTTVGGDSLARAVVIQPDGRIVVGGSTSSNVMQISSFLAVRYLPDGTLDTGFNGGGIVTINNGTEFDIRQAFGIALQSDGRILLAGNTISDFSLARLMTDGSLDDSFPGGGLVDLNVDSYEETCRAIALQADGRIILAGSSVSPQLGRTRFAVARIESGALTPFARFRNTLAEAGLSGAAAEPNAEPFGDGVSNLLKYAFNMDLTGPDSSRLVRGSGLSGLPSFTTTASGEGLALEIQYIRRRNSGLIYTLKASETLAPDSFLPVSSVETVEVIDETWERVTSSIPMNVATKPRFFTTVEVRLE